MPSTLILMSALFNSLPPFVMLDQSHFARTSTYSPSASMVPSLWHLVQSISTVGAVYGSAVIVAVAVPVLPLESVTTALTGVGKADSVFVIVKETVPVFELVCVSPLAFTDLDTTVEPPEPFAVVGMVGIDTPTRNGNPAGTFELPSVMVPMEIVGTYVAGTFAVTLKVLSRGVPSWVELV